MEPRPRCLGVGPDHEFIAGDRPFGLLIGDGLVPGRAFIGANALMRPRGTMSRRVLTKRESAARLRSVRLPPDSCRMVRTSAGPGRVKGGHAEHVAAAAGLTPQNGLPGRRA